MLSYFEDKTRLGCILSKTDVRFIKNKQGYPRLYETYTYQPYLLIDQYMYYVFMWNLSIQVEKQTTKYV